MPPDPFRLRYRAALAETVRAMIKALRQPTEKVVRKMMPQHIEPNDRDGFTKLVVEEFKTIHAGNAVRFGLRALEFDAWVKSKKLTQPWC